MQIGMTQVCPADVSLCEESMWAGFYSSEDVKYTFLNQSEIYRSLGVCYLRVS